MKRETGFTLAEVLIAIVIIGVIATMTIPYIINTTKDKETVSRLNKTYSTLSQALNSSKAFNGDFSTWAMMDNNTNSISDAFDFYVQPHLKTIKVCVETEGCWSTIPTKSFNGSTTATGASTKGIGTNVVSFILADGTFVSMDVYGNSIETTFGVVENLIYPTLTFATDLNGDKGPNQLGKDVFTFVVVQNGLVPSGIDSGSSKCYNGATGSYAGYDCAAKVLKTGSTKY